MQIGLTDREVRLQVIQVTGFGLEHDFFNENLNRLAGIGPVETAACLVTEQGNTEGIEDAFYFFLDEFPYREGMLRVCDGDLFRLAVVNGIYHGGIHGNDQGTYLMAVNLDGPFNFQV